MEANKLASLTCAILVGGQGTRLRSVVPDLPKPLAPINGRPFLRYLLEQLYRAGCRRVVLCSGYKAELMMEAIGETWEDMEIVHSPEVEPLGTGGAIVHALKHFPAERIMVMNGDSYIDTDLNAFAAYHDDHSGGVSVLLTKLEDTARYGKVVIDEDQQIHAFEEKTGVAEPGLINAGIYIMRTDLLQDWSEHGKFSMECNFFPNHLSKELFGFVAEGSFIDIGTPESFRRAESFFSHLSLET